MLLEIYRKIADNPRFMFVKRHAWFLISLVFWVWLFFSLLSSHMIYEKPDGLYSGGSTWGDLAIHLTFINNFLERGFGMNDNPVFYGSKLTYSFFPDMLSAFLVKGGLSVRYALILPSFIFVLLIVVLMYVVTLKITKSRAGAFCAPFFFFFNGTLAGFNYFLNDYKISNQELFDFAAYANKSYAHLADFNIRFSNIIADYVLPQRTVLPGFVLGLMAVYFLWKYWETKRADQLLYAGMATAFLPWIHIHTFVSLNLIALGLALIELFEVGFAGLRGLVLSWLRFGLPVALVGLPQFAYIYPWGKESFSKFHFGWMSGDESIWSFWPKNLSPHLYVFVLAIYFAEKRVRIFYLPFLALFILTNLFLFQPHDYDNMKIMLWWFFGSIVMVGGMIGKISEWPKKYAVPIVAIIFVSMTLVGGLSVYREYYVSWKMFGYEDFELAQFVKKNTEPESLFLTTDQHNHPVSTLAGRQLMMGFRGWLWTHGVDYRQREVEVFDIFSGSERASSLIKKYDVDYVVIDKNKIEQFHINQRYFVENYKLVFENIFYEVYALDWDS